MSEKFHNKYRIPSARMQTWDYGSNGLYFITICTHNREPYFGEIQNGEMILSEIGILAHKYWHEIPKQFPYVKLDKFVVMPNHVHGIIIIDKPDGTDAIDRYAINDRDAINRVSIVRVSAETNKTGGITNIKNPMFHENISRIIRWYKGRCSYEIHKIHADFAWQSRFHDHIIRNNTSYENIRNYIINNPKKWKGDKFYK